MSGGALGTRRGGLGTGRGGLGGAHHGGGATVVEQFNPVGRGQGDAGELGGAVALANAAAAEGLEVVVEREEVDEVLAEALAGDLHRADAGVDALDVGGGSQGAVHGAEDGELDGVGEAPVGGLRQPGEGLLVLRAPGEGGADPFAECACAVGAKNGRG